MQTPRYTERLRQLPYNGTLRVQPGDQVDESSVIGEQAYLPGTMRRVLVAPKLRIDGQQLASFMLLSEGARVEVGDVIAATDCFGERRAVSSPYSGYVGLISRTLGQVFIREPVPVGAKEPVVLDITSLLGIKPVFLNDYLRVRKNDTVVFEQVIAVAGSGTDRRFVTSPIYGRITSIADGQVTITPTHVSTEIKAYLAGRVVRISDGQSATIGSLAHVISGQYGVGGEAGGELLIANRPDDELQLSAVSDNWRGKVVVGGCTASLAVLRQAASVGAVALVLGHLPLRTLLDYAGASTLGLTGNEQVTMTLILLAGFLPAAIPNNSWSTLSQLAGRYASVNGATHVRAGALRPEIVISERKCPEVPPSIVPVAPEIAVGTSVRITSGPLAGTIGLVNRLPAERQRIATGSLVRVAELSLGGRETVIMPVSNLASYALIPGGALVASKPAVLPELFTASTDARALIMRFGGWPDDCLSRTVLSQIVHSPDELDAATVAHLSRLGLMSEVGGRQVFGLPIFEQLPLLPWADVASRRASQLLADLRASVQDLKRGYEQVEMDSNCTWSEVAHGLLVGYLLAVCGGMLLRKLYLAETLAVVVANPAVADAVWLRFNRANGQFGVCSLAGGPYPQTAEIADLLQRSEVGDALSGLSLDASLLVPNPRALAVLIGLSGVTADTADQLGLFHAAWPLLHFEQLRSVRAELQSVCLALARLIRAVLPEMLVLPETLVHLRQGDLAYAAYALLARRVVDDLLEEGLLPAIVTPRVDHLIR